MKYLKPFNEEKREPTFILLEDIPRIEANHRRVSFTESEMEYLNGLFGDGNPLQWVRNGGFSTHPLHKVPNSEFQIISKSGNIHWHISKLEDMYYLIRRFGSSSKEQYLADTFTELKTYLLEEV